MKKYLLPFLLLPIFLFAKATDRENYPKGQINKIEEKKRSIDFYSHSDIIIYQSTQLDNSERWTNEGTWETKESVSGVGFSGSYEANSNCRLISPKIDLPAIKSSDWEKIVLRFDESFSLESFHDIAYVEISNDNEKSWTIIDSRSGTTDDSWKKTSLFLDNYSGQTIRLAFRFTSDENFSGKGWFLKNLSIEKSTYQPIEINKLNNLSQTPLKSAQTGINGTMNSLNSQNFPYIYMNVLLSENGTGVSNLTKNNFTLYEDDVLISNFNVVPPDAASGAKLVDIVFLVDNSGSFDDEQNAVRNNMESFVNQLAASGNDFALGLCRFGQDRNGGYPILEDNGQLTSNIEYFKNTVWLRNVTTGSTEVGYNAIVKSAQGFNFRPGAQKIFIILTDETPDQGGSTKQDANSACLNNYITLFAMTNYESAALNDIAAATNGRSYDITDPFNDILNDISSSVNNNYLISYRSPDPTFNGIERQVKVHATSTTGTSTNILGSYVPGAAPHIERTAETINYGTKGWDQGAEFAISVIITDSKEPFTTGATLYYKHSTDAAYTSVEMNNTYGDTWSATIPSSASLNPGVDYYITATDGNVTSSLPKVEPNVNPFQIGILPNEKPVITHNSPGNYSPGQSLIFNATVTDITNWIASVTLWYRNPGELLFSPQKMTNTSGNFYSCQVTTSTSATGIEYYIVAEDDLGLKSYWASADYPEVLTSGQSPNLSPYTLEQYDWTSPLVIALTEDATEDASVIYDNQEIYINFAYNNDGNSDAGSHKVQILIDGSVNNTWSVDFSTDPGYINFIDNYNIGTLSSGTHTILMKIDSDDDITESDETDNVFSKNITILPTGTSVANLAPYTPEGWSNPVVLTTTEGTTTQNATFYDDEDVFLNLAYANFGEGDAGPHYSYIYIDETADTLYWPASSGLESMTYLSTTDYNLGNLSVGEHIVRFVADVDNYVLEANETDNEFSDTINVLPRYQPNLLPYTPSGWDGSLVISTVAGTHSTESAFNTNDEIYIDGAFENNGSIESGVYRVRIYVDSMLYLFEDDEGLDLVTYKYVEDFNVGKLSQGSHDITLFVDCFNDVSETDENDNMKTMTIEVDYPTGVSENQSDNNIKIWPNPGKHYFNIDLGKPSDAEIKVYNLSGRLVHHSRTNNEQIKRITTEEMTSGSYIIRISNNNEIYNRKLIIQK